MRIEPVFLLAGPEAGKRAAFIDELRASIVSTDGSPAEEHRLYAQDTSVGQLLSLLRNGSLFSSRRLVEYRGAELAKGKTTRQPVVLVRGAEFATGPGSVRGDVVMPLEMDLFR